MTAKLGCTHDWVKTEFIQVSPFNTMLKTGIKYMFTCSKCGVIK